MGTQGGTVELWAVEVLYSGVWLETAVRQSASEAFTVACGRRCADVPSRVALRRYRPLRTPYGPKFVRVS